MDHLSGIDWKTCLRATEALPLERLKNFLWAAEQLNAFALRQLEKNGTPTAISLALYTAEELILKHMRQWKKLVLKQLVFLSWFSWKAYCRADGTLALVQLKNWFQVRR